MSDYVTAICGTELPPILKYFSYITDNGHQILPLRLNEHRALLSRPTLSHFCPSVSLEAAHPVFLIPGFLLDFDNGRETHREAEALKRMRLNLQISLGFLIDLCSFLMEMSRAYSYKPWVPKEGVASVSLVFINFNFSPYMSSIFFFWLLDHCLSIAYFVYNIICYLFSTEIRRLIGAMHIMIIYTL